MKYLFIIAVVVFFASPTTFASDRWESYYDDGCAFWQCPLEIQQEIIKENNGLKPPSEYERLTEIWWRSTCTYSPNECK